MENSKNKFNPVVYQKQFQDIMTDKKISLVAPASGVNVEELAALGSLENYHIHINIPPDLIDESAIFYSNTDQKRLQFLQQALLDPSRHQLIWTLRGGYGSARLIDSLKKMPKPQQEKIFIGFSDTTALHLFFSQYWGWKTIHGAVLNQLLDPEKDPQNFIKIAEILTQPKKTYTALTNLAPLNTPAIKATQISGSLTGGNLTLVESSIGTDWQINTFGKILFLEDHKEPGYKLDRSFNHLKQAGLLRNVKAVILGDFGHADEDITIALRRFAEDTQIPIFKSDQFGHGNQNYPLIYNAMGTIVQEEEKTDNFELMMTP